MCFICCSLNHNVDGEGSIDAYWPAPWSNVDGFSEAISRQLGGVALSSTKFTQL
jgi:hypothetical protein